MTTRCFLLNNPCAIRRGSAWKGLSLVQCDKEFCRFKSRFFGYRAFYVLMRTYHYKYKCNTIKDIISRYAPITENNTSAYIAFVCQYISENCPYFESGRKPEIDENFVVNMWYNSTSPSMWLDIFCQAVSKMESDYVPTQIELDNSKSLLY